MNIKKGKSNANNHENPANNLDADRDIIAEMAKASKKAGLKYGIYYCQRDWLSCFLKCDKTCRLRETILRFFAKRRSARGSRILRSS